MSLFGQNQGSGSSVFGQNNQNTQKPNLFGSLNTNNAQSQQGSSLFGSNATSQPQQSGSLFGSSNTTQTQPGSLFGQANASQTQQSGGLFGSSQPQQSQAPSLFGAASTQQQQQPQGSSLLGVNQQQSNSSGLFGQSSQPQQTSSLFGGSLGQNQGQQNQQGSGLFGASTLQQPKPTLSLFPNQQNQQQQQQQQQQQRPLLFSNPSTGQAPQQQNSILGASTLPALGASQARQQTVPGVKIDVTNLRGTTRFNDLHDELQKQIEQIDNFIQQQIQFKEQCDALIPAHGSNLDTVPNDVKLLQGMADTVELAMDNDTRDINAVKDMVSKDVDNAKISFRAVENLKLPQQFHYSGMYYGAPSTSSPTRALNGRDQENDGVPADLVSYFSSTATDLSHILEMYKTQLAEIEDHMRMVEGNAIVQSQQMAFKKGSDGGQRSENDQVQELSAVLNSFWNSINGVAEKVGGARHEVQQYLLNNGKL